MKHIETVLKLTKWNAKKNPRLHNPHRWRRYADGIVNEVAEAKKEVKKNNAVYLEDELGDIFWDYANLLRTLEKQGYIRSVNRVFARAAQKYTERAPALPVDGQGKWQEIKAQQKIALKKQHERYQSALKKR